MILNTSFTYTNKSGALVIRKRKIRKELEVIDSILKTL